MLQKEAWSVEYRWGIWEEGGIIRKSYRNNASNKEINTLRIGIERKKYLEGDMGSHY